MDLKCKHMSQQMIPQCVEKLFGNNGWRNYCFSSYCNFVRLASRSFSSASTPTCENNLMCTLIVFTITFFFSEKEIYNSLTSDDLHT